MLPTKAIKAIIKKEDKILILQRNPKTRPTDNWDLPGGLQEEGESEEETLLRELQEELGVETTILSKGKTWSFKRLKNNKLVNVQNYVCDIDTQEIVLSDEHKDFKYLTPQEIRHLPVKDSSIHQSLI